MNIRFDAQNIRIRLSETEFNSLCDGQIVKQNTYLPHNSIFSVSLTVGEQDETYVVYHDECFQVNMPRADCVAFQDSLPTHDGLEKKIRLEKGDDLVLTLEVDVRTHRRKH